MQREPDADVLDRPTFLERYIFSSVRIEQYGLRPDNYEMAYMMHNQQPWVNRPDKPCLATYNPVSRIDEDKVVKTWWFQVSCNSLATIIHRWTIIRFF